MNEPLIAEAIKKTTDQEFLEDIISGLSQDQKTLPCKYFYDETGSELFEQICELEEYYLTRTELEVLEKLAPELPKHIPTVGQIVEFGSGNCEKVSYLLSAYPAVEAYVPIDVSEEFMLDGVRRLAERFPDLEVAPVVGDFMKPLKLFDKAAPRLGFFPGSTIGNLNKEAAKEFLVNSRKTLGKDSYFVVGADLLKDEETLLRAYDDSEGVTGEFNLNILKRIQKELPSDLDPDNFEHEARFNEQENRIEMHLRSLYPQTVRVDGHYFDFEEGETIHTENSHKYSVEGFAELAESASWSSAQTWIDDENKFSVHLLKSV